METRFCCLLEHPWQKFSLNHCPPEPPEKRVKKKRRRGSSEFSWISVHELTKKCKCEQTYVERLLYKNKNQLGNSKQYAKLQEVEKAIRQFLITFDFQSFVDWISQCSCVQLKNKENPLTFLLCATVCADVKKWLNSWIEFLSEVSTKVVDAARYTRMMLAEGWFMPYATVVYALLASLLNVLQSIQMQLNLVYRGVADRKAP